MATLSASGMVLVDDAGIMWRRSDAPHGGGGLGDLGFNWEAFSNILPAVTGSAIGIIGAVKGGGVQSIAQQGYYPQSSGGGGFSASAAGFGSEGGFSMSPQTMLLLGGGALVLILLMKRR